MSIRVGIVGISGFGGGEAMRLVASHPSFELIYAAGEGSAGSRLVDRFPGVPAKLAELVIEKWDPVTLPKLDVLFASLPTGASAEALARVPKDVKIVDIGGDHRYVEGWAYGLADVWPAQIEGQIRVANPGCFPAATLNALAPLLVNKLIEPGNIVIDVKTGISGAGRGGADSKFGYAESNENLVPYGLLKHVHMPEMAKTIELLSGVRGSQPRFFCALEISGRRWRGSSCGNGRNSIREREPVSEITSSPSSRIDISAGLPTLIGPSISCDRFINLVSPSIRSST